ncbi:hypothetical protein [Pseudidiomarina aestuarii]|uniref:hypothetical protein n=1 Tax=Pseudidiomarina aestuarii TaxID=624146 RepID=UPI003A974C07
MFSAMNQHKYLDLIEIHETYKDCLRIVLAEAGVSDVAPQMSSDEEPNEALRKLLNESKRIEIADNSARYEIVFDDYIAYAVTNESYAGGIEGSFEGRLARVYSESAFLNYISQATLASADYPRSFAHYGFCCLNQIIDVVSERPPTVRLLSA